MIWRFNGKATKSPAKITVILLILAVLIPLTLPFHLVKWFFDGDGFIDRGPWGKDWHYEPGIAGTLLASGLLVGTLLIVLNVV